MLNVIRGAYRIFPYYLGRIMALKSFTLLLALVMGSIFYGLANLYKIFAIQEGRIDARFCLFISMKNLSESVDFSRSNPVSIASLRDLQRIAILESVGAVSNSVAISIIS